jgi:ubiquitin carboxyl-terminal hydrolase 14
MPLDVHIKHAGKIYDVALDPDQPPSAFKDAVYHLTGVPPDRMKVMVKGGMLKDDSDWKKIAPKEVCLLILHFRVYLLGTQSPIL